jgi:glucokinase
MMAYYLGVDLGGTNIVAGVADANHKLLEKHRRPTRSTRPHAEVVEDIVAAARSALVAAGLTEADIDNVGVGIPGPIDPRTHRVIYCANLDWRDVDVIGEFRRLWDIPVHLANDADCAALGESVAGAGRDYDSALMITLGTGVGGGLVIGRRLFLGAAGYGTEPGHSLLKYGGLPCACGRRGCIESYASVTALIRQTIDSMSIHRHSLMWEECGRDLNRVSGRTSFDAARRGDEAALTVVRQYIEYVGESISSLVACYSPHAVLVGGGVSNEGDYLLDPVREVVARTMYGRGVLAAPTVLKARLGYDAGILGAALLGTQA